MGHWGIKSYENDTAADAIDAAIEQVHGDRYDELMDDRNPLTFDEAQQRLSDPATLAAAVEILRDEVGADIPFDDWDEVQRLGFAGLVVRHAEFGVAIPADWLNLAITWLETEAIDWETEATLRRLRREHELALLRKHPPSTS